MSAVFHDIHFLKTVLSDIGDPKPAECRIEAEAPWIAEPPGEYFLGPSFRVVCKGVVERYTVILSVLRGIHIDAKHLAKEDAPILRVALWITAGSAVAHADIQISVWSEYDLSAVVIAVRLCDGKNDQLRCGIGLLGIRHRNREAGYHSAARIRRSIIHVEIAVFQIGWVESESKQAFLASSIVDPVTDVKEDVSSSGIDIIRENENLSRLFDDKKASTAIAGMLHIDGTIKRKIGKCVFYLKLRKQREGWEKEKQQKYS